LGQPRERARFHFRRDDEFTTVAAMGRITVCAIACVAVAACKRERAAPPPTARGSAPPAPVRPLPHDVIPRTTGEIHLDGEWNEPDWSKRALRAQFLGDDGQLARPSSEVRLLRDDRTLYVGLYAADENIQAHADAFDFSIGSLALRVDVSGQITPPTPGVQAAVDHDGTLDDPSNFDEEWVVELVIPLDKTGLAPGAHVPVHAARCDVTKDNERRCGSWSGSVTIE
jgi:hypothetical protein